MAETMARLLDRVADAADALRAAELERERARERLRDLVREAAEEGIPLTTIARRAGIGRQRIRSLVGR